MACGRYRTVSSSAIRPSREPGRKAADGWSRSLQVQARREAAPRRRNKAMSERRSTGSRVHDAREAKELSLRRAARRLGVSPRVLRGWERGREDIPFAVRQGMVKLYGLPSEQLIPERPAAGAAGRDGSNGMIRIGSVTFATHDADDDSLLAFLATVRQERG